MPRGHGHIQRGILDVLSRADHWTEIEIARWVFDRQNLKPYQLSNIIRALRVLERQGDVQISPYVEEGQRCWSAIRKQRPKQKVIRAPRLVVIGREAD